MKLIQLNAWGGRLEKQVLQFLIKENADFVCLQESISISGGADSGFFLTIEQIEKQLKYTTAFAPTFSFPHMNRQAYYGNSILSRLAFDKFSSVYTRSKFKANFDFATDDVNIRNLLHAELTISDCKVHILTHHGHHIPAHKKGDSETMKQCKQIAEYVSKLEGKIILTGDFNLEPTSKSLMVLNNMLTNLSVQANLTTTRNGLTHKTEVCDYIFVNDLVKVNSFKAVDVSISDHLPLILDFD